MQHITVIPCQRIGSRVKKPWISSPLKMGPMGCPETLLRNYNCTLHNIPEEHRSYHHHVMNLVFCACLENTIKYVFFYTIFFYNLMLTVCKNSDPFSTLSLWLCFQQGITMHSDLCHMFVVKFWCSLIL